MGKINLSGVQSGPPPRPPSAQPLSGQQEAAMDFIEKKSGNLILEARAGTGKTYTLIEMSKLLRGGANFLAFNKAIATEIQGRLASAGISEQEVKGATFHSVGCAAWYRHAPASRTGVRAEKLSLLSDKIGMPRNYRAFAVKAVSLAKQALVGAVPDLPIDDEEIWSQLVDHFDLLDLMPDSDYSQDEDEWLQTGLSWALWLLRNSIGEAMTMIDFDDMIYMPLYANLRFYQKPWVLVDEAQDTNRARREIATRILAPGGRLVAVGDRYQAIYGFTGANADALDLIQEKFQCDILPLTITYRCAESIVNLAQTWVPDIEARPGAPLGVVRQLSFADFQKLTPEPTDAILCRNVKPLVEVAFGYLRRHIGCHVEGREIGAQLIGLLKKTMGNTIHQSITNLQDHLERERDKLLHQHKEDKLARLEDQVDTLLVLAEGFPEQDTPQRIIDLINKLFKDEEGLARRTITLSTVHKAKGREWDRVYLLGRSTLMPSSYARQEWQLQQEQNLMYVAVTRAREEFIDVDLAPRRR